MSREKHSKYQADKPKPEPFLTPERKKLYLLMAVVDGVLFLAIIVVAKWRFVPLYPTAPALAFIAVVFNYALMFLKRDVLMNTGKKP
ncbi:hypothetical protein Acid345_1953 [Candidatus Koribacter versatilis Ellin345]|uniref:Uncharacterized protein n=1 Tax=Koribacter versatilis (strain Ellin345) TaxID=204669 RepID=Q1IQ96_KORVE|nr:hypothetical protein [Candidatus Koribacter versatilis]ABF40954.1 hypothetical protein Acid345_1953 [Candidatus Koribacter versatilis Ellin345]